MAKQYLDFERPLQEISSRIYDLEEALAHGEIVAEKNPAEEIDRLKLKYARIARQVYRHLSAWQKVQVARHPARPQPADYAAQMITDFQPLAGDRQFAEDPAMLAGLGRFNGKPVAILGINKGKDTKQRMAYNFCMPKPEGYRKAKRIMEMADRFNLPLITLVDTPGAYPGVDAEARGQAEAIAACIETLLKINVPVVSVVTGEGGSGGALALAVADIVMMLEHSIYSVISPEGCASILWREANKQTIPEAAEALCLTAQDLVTHNLVDKVIKEPVGSAHHDAKLAISLVQKAIADGLAEAVNANSTALTRREKFLKLTR